MSLLYPVAAAPSHYFHPLRSEPATSLVHEVPPGKDLTLLLLGCGDPGNILFTNFGEEKNGFKRRLDITCCDLEPAVIARNILLLTLLIDQGRSGTATELWSVFYNFYIDSNTFQSIHKQSQKLVRLSRSLNSWEASEYGGFLRMVNSETIELLHQTWTDYCRPQNSTPEFIENFMEGTDVGYHKLFLSDGADAFCRSLGAQCNAFQKEDMEEYGLGPASFWENGDCEPCNSSENPLGNRLCNPLFAYSSTGGTRFVVSPATWPLAGFHLVTAFSELTPDSPYYQPQTGSQKILERAAAAAKLQFESWCESFRKIPSGAMILRFVVADALPFCIKLRDMKPSGHENSDFLYSRPWSTTAVRLDGSDYRNPSAAAHLTTFDVIDCAYLANKVGFLNLAPHLVRMLSSPTSVLYAGMKVPKVEQEGSLLSIMLASVDIGTACCLLGIVPTTYISGLSAKAYHQGHPMLGPHPMMTPKKSHPVSNRITWKISTSLDPASDLASPRTFVVPRALADFGCSFLLDMFPNIFTPDGIPVVEPQRYTVASFAALVAFFKERMNVKWDQFVSELIKEIESRHSTHHVRKEISVYFHLYGIRSMPSSEFRSTSQGTGVLGNGNCAVVIALVVTIPRKQLQRLSELLLTPSYEPILAQFELSLLTTSGTLQHRFSCLYPVFGKLVQCDDKQHATVDVDPAGWSGESDLQLWCYFPGDLLLDPKLKKAEILIIAKDQFLGVSGASAREFLLLKTPLHGEKVHLFESFPGLPSPRSNFRHAGSDEKFITKNDMVRIGLPALDFGGLAFATSLTISKGSDNKTTFSDSEDLQLERVTHTSPCTVTVNCDGFSQRCDFPFPILGKSCVIEVNRDEPGSYRLIVPLVSPFPCPEGSYPINMLRSGTCGDTLPNAVLSTWNLPYVDFKQLPKLDIKAPGLDALLQPHLCSMFSMREIALRESNSDAMCNLKNVVHAVLSPKDGILRLKSSDPSAFPIFFFLGALYLDLNSHSMVRDVRALVVTAETSHLASSAGLIATQITLAEIDMSLWRRGLFALSERCRDWAHAPTCEYQSCDDVQGFCPCGKGQTDFDSLGNSLKSFAPHLTRVAISTLFSAPYLESRRESSGSGMMERNLRTERFKQFEPVTDGEVKEGAKPKCGVCAKECSTRCAKCKRVAYCSKECQTKGWKVHKRHCAAPRAAKPPGRHIAFV